MDEPVKFWDDLPQALNCTRGVFHSRKPGQLRDRVFYFRLYGRLGCPPVIVVNEADRQFRAPITEPMAVDMANALAAELQCHDFVLIESQRRDVNPFEGWHFARIDFSLTVSGKMVAPVWHTLGRFEVAHIIAAIDHR